MSCTRILVLGQLKKYVHDEFMDIYGDIKEIRPRNTCTISARAPARINEINTIDTVSVARYADVS